MKLFVEECLVVLLLLELKRIFKFQFSELNWAAGIFPDVFVAFFYSGLGCALALAGVVFLRNYIVYNRLLEKETETV